MSKPSYESLFNYLILSILVFFVVRAFTLTGGAGRVPLIVGIPTLLLMSFKMLIPLIKKTSLKKHGRQVIEKNKIDDSQKKILSEIMWLCIFTLLILFFGIILGSLAFLIMYLRIHNNDSTAFSITVGITVVLGVYLIFQQALQMQLYEGILPGIILERLYY